MIRIDEALKDPNLLGAALGDAASWTTWLVVLRAAFGLPLSAEDRETFATVAGGREPPPGRVSELFCVIGRRGGKSRTAAAVAVMLAACEEHVLAPGEVGYVPVIAASRPQAAVVFKYALGFLQASPVLRQEIRNVTVDEVELRSGVTIGTQAGSFRTVRGRTLVGCVFDEVAFWRDDTSASPDVETYTAVLPALATTRGMLVGISSPYRKAGLLHAKHRDHFGQPSPDVLVVAGPSKLFNETLDDAAISRARAADPEAARAEWDAEFRSDISGFLDSEIIEAAVDYARPLELPPRQGITYRAHVDPSGGRHDAFTICIAHTEGDRFVADVVRGRRPPFDPSEVVREFAALCRDHGIREVSGDNYSAAWVEAAFQSSNLTYKRSDMPASGLYLETLPLFMRGAISIPNHKQLLRELRGLERRTHRSGRDTVDHGPSGHDDHANALAGAARALARPVAFSGSGAIGVDGRITWDNKEPKPRARAWVRRIITEKEYLERRR